MKFTTSIRVHSARTRLHIALLSVLALLAAAATPARADAAEEVTSPLLAAIWEDAALVTSLAPAEYSGSMYWVAQEATGAADFWSQGYTGAGVDVALIDSGVVPVDGLTYPNKVINGPDLSFESQADNLRYLDTYGHGTHMAGIIAGRDDAATTVQKGDDENFLGMAPGARILNVKVADAQGAVDVSQVIAGIDWVVQHRNDDGMNVRVLNLSYGTDGLQDYQIDPLAQAVERAWQAGIVVVVASGNDGNDALLRNPAYDPFVIAVGASHGNSTYTASDDTIATFSNCGTDQRHVDIVAPGKSIISLRNPDSAADVSAPEAVVDERFFLGSGTSQAAAVVSGGVALLLEQRPEMSPNQVKALLMGTAEPISGASELCQGAGQIDLTAARDAASPKPAHAVQRFTESTGTGSLEAARGTIHVYDNDIALAGEQDIMGNPWTGYCTGDGKKTTCVSTLWDGGVFNGASWSGASWSGASWSGASWSGASWSGASWSGASWSSKTWSGASWSGASWSGASWSGGSWSGASWSGHVWNGLSWH